MKYPQLVSTRAVNAISDWLVSRLEQIGVEAPLIYSRLLLSLLHSSVQINDPIEFNNLEKYFSNQKGNKRFPPCDTETIKKFTAIQCLLDAVSTEQEISIIEKLVDELFEKLIKLEKQVTEENSDIEHQLPANIKKLDIEDPRKRYYRAFPALSKEMENTVWLSKHAEKSLTWPTGNSEASSSNMVALNNTAGVKRKNKRRRNQALNKGRINSVRKNSYGGSTSPTWDTDFEGNWEMGTDLIKEFLMSQKNRNRSISESDAIHFHYDNITEKRMKPGQEVTNASKLLKVDNTAIESSTVVFNAKVATNNMAFKLKTLNKIATKSGLDGNSITPKNRSVVRNIDDDKIACVPYEELISFKDFDNASNMSRQLYEDEVAHINDKSMAHALQQENDFAQFEAKFNSDVEALWKNTTSNEKNNQMASVDSNMQNQRSIDNFWTNYYNHHYNDGNYVDKSIGSFDDNKDKANNNVIADFYSLPTIFNKSQDSIEKNVDKKNENDVSSFGVYITDSIWSDNSYSSIKKEYSEDDSFYSNGWASKDKSGTCDKKDLPNSFNISKWSECSFETPFIPSSAASSTSTNIGATTTKQLYGSNYKHPVAASTNKVVGGATVIPTQQTNVLHQPPQSISFPDYCGSSSLRSFEKSPKQPQSNVSVLVSQQQQQAINASTSSTTTTTTSRTVSLTNHSRTSGFVEYSIVKSSSSFFQFNQILKFDRNASGNQNRTVSTSLALPRSGGLGEMSNESLTAPVVNSSASSSSPLDDDENLLTSYRTHFRPIRQNYADGHQFDISGSLDEIEFERSKSGSLYLDSDKYFEYTRVDTFLSEEDSSGSSSLVEDSKLRGGVNCASSIKGLYPLKFRAKQVDKQCQTDDAIKLFAKANRTENVIIGKKRDINKFAPAEFVNSTCDEVDCCTDSDGCFNEENTINLGQWTMAEIGKKCADNNNSHTLWGMCPDCNKVNKCIPANRLLKDELITEADEIMSDLKYMQDLYICNDWENDDDNDTDSEIEALKNDYSESGSFENANSVYGDDDDENSDEQEQIFYNITKLISDLLKPENAKSLVDALSAGAANQNKNIFKGICSEDDELADDANNLNASLFDYQKNKIWKNVNNNNEKYIGGLWSNDENIIWKREIKPWSNWPRMNDNKTTTFLEEMNWKHTNLAAIWKNGSVAGGPIESEMKSLPSSSSSETKEMQTISSTPNTNRSTNETQMSSGNFVDPSDEHIESKAAMTQANSCIVNTPISWNISASKPYANSVDFGTQQPKHLKIDQQRAKCCSIGSQTTANRSDRKRRHSASQNIGCSGNCKDIGRMTLEWGDDSSSNCEMTARIGNCNKVEIMAKWQPDSSKISSIMHNVDDSLTSSSLSPKTTIITCKYWTTMDTTLASPYFLDKSSHFDGIGAMALNPSSILRHVTVVSRPLTR